jgi:antitoxin component YwqK of YwqJK toxin-antitoxin module
MSTSIKYNNDLGNEISSSQVDNLQEYFKVYLENNLPFKEERYQNGLLVNTSFNVTSQTQIDTVLLTNPGVSFEYEHLVNGFKIKEFLSYNNNVLAHKRILIYNSTDENICYCKYKLENNVFIPEEVEKYYYENGALKYKFDYSNNDLTLYMIYNYFDPQSDIYPQDIGNAAITNFTWIGFEYYQNAEPIIPV